MFLVLLFSWLSSLSDIHLQTGVSHDMIEIVCNFIVLTFANKLSYPNQNGNIRTLTKIPNPKVLLSFTESGAKQIKSMN